MTPIRESLTLSEIFGLAKFHGWKAEYYLLRMLGTDSWVINITTIYFISTPLNQDFFSVVSDYLTFDDIAKLYH